jgi:hypothetical protein
MRTKIVMLTGAAVAAVAVAAGASASTSGRTAPSPESASPSVELVWGTGEAPRYVARPAAPTAAWRPPAGSVVLRRGTGGPPEYVPYTAS